jgi:hypothetical protein
MKHGCLGYGIYALLTEMLESEHSHRLTKDYADIAYILREDADIIRSVVEDFGLFADMGDCFTTHYHQRMIAARIEAGRKGGKISKRKQTQAKCTFAYPALQNTPDLEGENKQNTDLLITNESTDNTLSISNLQTNNPPSNASTDKQTEAKCCFAYFAYSDTAKEEKESDTKKEEEKELLKEKLSIESKKKSTSIDDRKAKFYNDLIPYVETYGKDMIREFYDYWSEANRSATKMRWEQERTWELNLRLKYWAKRDNKYGRNNKQADAERRQSQIIAQVAELDRKFLAGQTQ